MQLCKQIEDQMGTIILHCVVKVCFVLGFFFINVGTPYDKLSCVFNVKEKKVK